MSGSDPSTHTAAPMPTFLPAPVLTRTADELTERFLLRAQPHTPRHGLASRGVRR